ncbi:SDR family NAD(P)-dependent oxidoreductase [Sphingobium sp. DEHP117]|uniref:SDR family NAD(P)-dependent oxidoreductase n=1 Tax=Sphingobium sp. DEHP117 TaxID=2993436 RepID=UPI0027D5D686|nr:SDR family oxidoreductase [Sphingobium sp. DEHP117]MDQ4421552.1 SDR family NAD(P)-dependent oxidoreductase [Sphingobium sp. DEHP117]
MGDRSGVVVTGAAQGLGRAIAERFMAGGCHVVGVDLAAEPLAAMARGREAFTAMHGDAGDPELIAEACRIACVKGQKLRTIVLNAAISIVHPTDEYPLDDWDKVMGVNLRGVFAAAKSARPFLAAGSSVVLLSSIAASHALPGRVAYCASKAGVDGLMRALAIDWGPHGIRVNAVAPGTFRTEMLAKLVEEGKADISRYISRIPMQRAGEAEELANAAFFLASDQASFINGVVLPVDGGWAAAALSNV